MATRSINRTATFAWSPSDGPARPVIATGTVAGALDASFSNASTLEIIAPRWGGSAEDRDDEAADGKDKGLTVLGKLEMDAKFNRLAWGHVSREREAGVIAAGLENGSIDFWDAAKIKGEGVKREDAWLAKESNHTGPVRGLDFNHSQNNLVASGATKAEIFVWDLNHPTKPYSPGERSTRLDDVTALAWNNAQAPHILASGFSNGQVSVWHLINKREALTITHPAIGPVSTSGSLLSSRAGGGLGGLGGGAGGQGGAISAIHWNPENSTQLITASEDDSSSAICVWDLRNARAPERVLRGHEKGVLSLAWCRQDPNLLLSSGKDNKTLCWDMSTSSVVGELPSSSNWTYQVEWCPRNPNIFATASFDGKLTIQPLQHTGEDPSALAAQAAAASATGADLFEQSNLAMTAGQSQGTGFKLSAAPKWLRRPAGASWGFPGCLVTTSSKSKVVKLQKLVTEAALVSRVKALEQAIDQDSLKEFAQDREAAMVKPTSVTGDDEDVVVPRTRAQVQDWTLLSALYQANSRDQLVSLLGFSKGDIVHELESKLKKMHVEPVTGVETPGRSPSDVLGEPESPAQVASGDHVDGEAAVPLDEAVVDGEATAARSAEGVTPAIDSIAPHEKTSQDAIRAHTTDNAEQPPLFSQVGENDPFANLHHQRSWTDRLRRGERSSMSVAATAGESGPPSVTSGSIKSAFKIYPKDGSDTDKLITRAIVMGDYESAVSLCLHDDRPADALIMAGCGGPDLLKRTREAYIEKKTQAHPYLRLLQNILSNDLEDVVQSAALDEWQEIFVVLCTFAKSNEFSDLAEALGMRIEYQYTQTDSATTPTARSLELRKNAVLCFLAAGRLERIIWVWIEEMQEEEKKLSSASGGKTAYDAHVHALQNLIEKVTVFKHASGYVDQDFGTQGDAGPEKVYKLSALYDKYLEYAEILGNQGLVKSALRFVEQVPPEYKTAADQTPDSAAESDTAAIVRDRLVQAAGKLPKTPVMGSGQADATASLIPPTAQSNGYLPAYETRPVHQADAYQQQQPRVQPDYYAPISSTNGQYGQPLASSAAMSQMPEVKPAIPEPTPFATYDYPAHQAQPANYAPSYQPYQPISMAQGSSALPQPPPPQSIAPSLRAKSTSAWNDVPALNTVQQPKRTTASPAPILSPFPNAQVPVGYGNAAPGQMPPPMRNPTPGSIPPPPPSTQRMAGPPPPSARATQPAAQYGMPGQPGMNQGLMQRPNGPPNMIPLQNQGGPANYGPPQAAGQGQGRTPQYGAPATGGIVPPPRAGSIPPPSPMSQQPMTLPGQAPNPYAPPPGSQQQQGPPRPQTQGPPPISNSLPPLRPQSMQQQGPLPPPPPSQSYGAPPARTLTSTPPVGRGPPSSTNSSPFPPPAQRSTTPTAGATGTGISARGPPSRVMSPVGAAVPSKYPAGDRSHISVQAKPIYNVLANEIRRARQHATTSQMKRGVDDTEKRLNLLFDALNADSVAPDVVEDLLTLSRALESRDYSRAVQIQTDLHANKSELVRTWIIGLKQLISLARMIPQ